MSKLILSFEKMVIQTFDLNKEKITIGRKPENDIQVDNLAVSGHHATITTIHNDSVLEDLNSTNGTMVNGQPVTKHLLRDNDFIELGKHKLKYVFEPAATNRDFAKTMVIRRPAPGAPAGEQAPPQRFDPTPDTIGLAPSQPKPAAAPQPAGQAAVPAPVHAAAPQPKPRDGALQILSGGGAGRVLELTKNLTTVGKPGVQVAVFTRRPSGYFVTHVEGNQFPLFNGQPLGAQARPLNDNDTLEIAGIKMSFFYKS